MHAEDISKRTYNYIAAPLKELTCLNHFKRNISDRIHKRTNQFFTNFSLVSKFAILPLILHSHNPMSDSSLIYIQRYNMKECIGAKYSISNITSRLCIRKITDEEAHCYLVSNPESYGTFCDMLLDHIQSLSDIKLNYTVLDDGIWKIFS